jgi:hypothetical protein
MESLVRYCTCFSRTILLQHIASRLCHSRPIVSKIGDLFLRYGEDGGMTSYPEYRGFLAVSSSTPLVSLAEIRHTKAPYEWRNKP